MVQYSPPPCRVVLVDESGLSEGQKLGLRGRWWFKGWNRALTNLSSFTRATQNIRSMKIVHRLMRAVVRRDVHKAMGWYPDAPPHGLSAVGDRAGESSGLSREDA